ncbi:MAG: valine--tRNA ligase, partial [SAR202 cluster bacterium]|nr:valine--tRNA ligase [SAR202 cluster bacterium]
EYLGSYTLVDPEFGTGALKVTPGHDPADFEIGERHSLPIINILNPDGTMNENAAHYEGVDRLEVRTKIVEELDKEGLLVKIEPYRHSVGHCDRCGQIVEPIVSKQWYMSMEGLAKPAIEAVESGRIRVVPERFTKVYYNWMYNIKDWCISRQLWWGHRIPAWYCQDCNAVVVDLDDPTSCDQCGSSKLERDPDVLDTWFSSALWPHSTLGWPNQTEDLDYFYPGSVLETGHDILFFWVARMIMTGIENAGDIPFETIYLHGMVLDPTGIKMSKVKGNVLDPLDLADIYGADALRFALTTGNSPGNDMRLNESKMEASRNFANKIWNASRFVMAKIERSEGSVNWSWPPTPEHLEDRWIVARLQTTVSNVDRYMKEFQFGEAQREVHDFLWGEYCDWYLEMSKIRMRAGDDSPLPILAYVLEQTLRLLHPFMPFITEEIWGTLIKMLPAEYDAPSALIVASYPVADTSLADPQAESDIGAVIEMVRAIRNLRAEFRIEANRNVEAIVDAPDIEKVIESESAAIVALAQVDPLIMTSGSSSDGAGDGDSVSLVLSRGTVTVPLEGLVDVDREKARLTEELQQIDSGAQRLSARLSKADFLSKAPPEVVEKERARLSALEDRRIRVAETISRLGG